MRFNSGILATAIAMVGLYASAAAQTAAPAEPLRAFIPGSISPEAAAIYTKYKPIMLAPRQKPLTTPAEYEALYLATEKSMVPRAEAAVKQLGATVIERKLDGVPVLEVRPKDYKDDGTVLIYVHGGGWVGGSARSSLADAAMTAEATGKRVISVEYTVAPKGRWQLITNQVVAVYKTVLAEGTQASHIGMFGGSAGGNIVAAVTFKLRDQGLPMPAALFLNCPAVDLTNTGDTRLTLAEADPILNPESVMPVIALYADPADVKNPYVSPIYGDFTKGYPPTLIQGGTKEWLLSDFVRIYQAIKTAGGTAELDLYEGMPHGFTGIFATAPEGKAALAEQGKFWGKYLPGKK
jgi:epsilon-lactone hydrolase